MADYRSVDNYPVTVGAKFWDNNLRVVQVTEVAKYSNNYQDAIQTWHSTTDGESDTLSGNQREWGRLVRYFEKKDAEGYPVGTNWSDAR